MACTSAPKPAAAPVTSAPTLTSASASATETDTTTAAEKWAEKKAAAEARATDQKARESLDPLAMGSELEESVIPVVERTPASRVRAKGPSELDAAMTAVSSASSVDDAERMLTQRLGRPSWTEAPKSSPGAKRRVWVASAGATCHRLVLEADGTMEVESLRTSEWRMLTGSARQNPCTGEIRRGVD